MKNLSVASATLALIEEKELYHYRMLQVRLSFALRPDGTSDVFVVMKEHLYLTLVGRRRNTTPQAQGVRKRTVNSMDAGARADVVEDMI